MNLPRPPFTHFVWLLLTLLALSACQQTPAPTLPGVDTLAATPGTVVAWGENFSGQTTIPAGLSGVTAVAGGGFHNLALKADGSVVAWGDNDFEQSTVPAGLSGVVAIAGGAYHSLALVPSPSTVYDFSGFLAPVDNLPVVNVVKAGSAVPLKFSLGRDFGLDIFESGYPKSERVACESAAPQDPVTETVTAGSSSLSYDAATGRYSYVWKTEKGWANTCRLLTLKLDDGSEHTALFRFTR